MTPLVSIVMPSHRGAERLPATLDSLRRQTVEPSQFEVLLTLDGPDPAARSVLGGLELPFQLTVLEQAHCGAAAARNLAASRARAPLLLFLDDDMSADPGLLAAHLDAHARDPGGVVLGYFHQPRESARIDLLADSADHWWAAHFAALARPDHRFTFRDLCTGNVSMAADLFADAGGLSGDFIGAAGEDYELGVRLLQRGVRFHYCATARSEHRYRATLAKTLRRAREEGFGHVRILRRHPDILDALDVARAARDAATGARSWVPWTPAWFLGGAPRLLAPAWHVLGAMKLRRRAGNLLAFMRYCAYWRGVRAELGSLRAQREFIARAQSRARSAREIEIRLPVDNVGLAARLAATPADAALIVSGSCIAGRIPVEPGAETLRAGHVAAALRGELAGATILAAMLERPGASEQVPSGDAVRLLPAGDRRIPEKSFVASFDLAHPENVLAGSEPYGHALLLIRDDAVPIGTMHLRKAPGSLLERASIEALLLEPSLLSRLLQRRRLLAPAAGRAECPPISVVVCTRDRAESLHRCVASLRALDYPKFEILVVDNASVSTATRQEALAAGCRYLREERPGLDWARNRGLREARYDIVAFTDDDVEVDRLWLQGIAAGFDSPAVRCVTGLVLPRELETRAQHLFEVYGDMGMSKGFLPMRWAAARLGPESLIRVDRIGIGANMAFHRSIFAQAGEFDTALDVGTPSGGGGDLDMLHRVLCAGAEIRYAPEALVWHTHRRDMAELEKQIGNNGRAFGVYLLKRWREGRVGRATIAWYVVRRWFPWLAGRWILSLFGRHRLPASILWAELRGAASALPAYLRTYRSDRRIRAGSVGSVQ